MAHTTPPFEAQPIWLVSNDRVVASARLATSRADRRRGLLGVSNVQEPLVLNPCSWVHTFGMRTAIDVVYVSHEGIVISTFHLRPWRVGPLTRKARFVVEAAPGSVARWNIKPGDKIEIRYGLI